MLKQETDTHMIRYALFTITPLTKNLFITVMGEVCNWYIYQRGRGCAGMPGKHENGLEGHGRAGGA